MQLLIGFALVAALLIGYAIGRSTGRSAPASPTPGPDTTPPDGGGKTHRLYAIAGDLEPIVQQAARPEDVLHDATFLFGVDFLASQNWTTEELLAYFRGESMICACLALEALACRARRTGDPNEKIQHTILESINDYVAWSRYFALRTLDHLAPAPRALCGTVLSQLDESWLYPAHLRVLEDFLHQRANAGETVTVDHLDAGLSEANAEQLETLDSILRKLPTDLGQPLLVQLQAWRAQRVDRAFLSSVGQLWEPASLTDGVAIIEHDAERSALQKLESTLIDQPRRSVILVGEHGVGKTTLVRGLARQLAAKGFLIFEASGSEIMAGQSYVGQLEERVRNLLSQLRARPVVWFVPDIHSLRLAGRHRYSTSSVLDMLIPSIETGEVMVIGETTPTAYQQLLLAKPRMRSAFEALRVSPLTESATRDLVRHWAEDLAEGESGLPRSTQDEAFLLAQQYLTDHAAPGNVLTLLDDTRGRLQAADPGGPVRIGIDDLITTLTQMTGLPASVLDDRQGLDLPGLRAFFEQRVMGQPEAVDCIVDRIAMIKAGVTDPSRPLGVFLFAGPTGTGKTEIAKTLAKFLFGSIARMIRLDMSEFQTPESLDRLLGSADKEQRGGALVDQIRKQPFSVILLDEFEKAHANVWDLFLQLFDDGRLTDREGSTADFRNAIVILTSNLGSHVPKGAGVGFTDETGRFSATSVMRAVEASFRKEFLNRLDRVVVFRPLGRDTMRDILHKELAEAFRRRGLRNREWAVEWDASAIEFLLDKGFTLDLGARPLRRAVERYLLTPLSQTIVNHQYPEGDQFLFVRAGQDRLSVDFVDPDAAEDDDSGRETHDTGAGRATLERVGLDPCGTSDELALLGQVYRELLTTTETGAWQAIKSEGLARMQEPHFWDSPDRFVTLGDIEYVDRLEAGLSSAGSLLDRLAGAGRSQRKGSAPRRLLGQVASRLFVLREAVRGVLEEEPREAFVSVEAWSDGHQPSKLSKEFVPRIGAMYEAWAAKRGMPMERLDTEGRLLSVSGYAAYALLRQEHGLHVWEIPVEGRRPQRAVVRVQVAPQPVAPADQREGLSRLARRTIAQEVGVTPAIVRRYQDSPSPLVRDSVSGWRSGRLERVFEGDFDLLGRALTQAD